MFSVSEDTTRLDPEDLKDLIPPNISTRAELNQAEQHNIAQGRMWAEAYVRRKGLIITSHFLKKVHHALFDRTWRWAGRFRLTEKNLGVPWSQIGVEVEKLCGDYAFQVAQSVYSPEERAVRFHHRLVWIHPFPNGNGRHARLMADLIALSQGCPKFTWGTQDLLHPNDMRKRYILALKEADRFNYDPLMDFARS